MGGAALARAPPAAGATVAVVVGVVVAVAAAGPVNGRGAAIVDVCGADTAAPANAMGFWPNRTLFTPCFTACEQSAMNCVRIFAKLSFSF